MTQGLQIKCKINKSGNGIMNAHKVSVYPLTLIKIKSVENWPG